MLLIRHFCFPLLYEIHFILCQETQLHPWAFGLVPGSQAKYKGIPLIGPFSFHFFILGSVIYHNLALSHERAHPEYSARLGTTLSVTEVTCCPFRNAKDGETRWNSLTSHFCLNLSAFLIWKIDSSHRVYLGPVL